MEPPTAASGFEMHSGLEISCDCFYFEHKSTSKAARAEISAAKTCNSVYKLMQLRCHWRSSGIPGEQRRV